MLINCPECNKEVSSEADKCIHCGYPIAKYLKTESKIEKKEQRKYGCKQAYMTFGTIEYISIPITGFFVVIFCVVLIVTNLEPFHNIEVAILSSILIAIISQGILQIIVFGILKNFFKEK